MDKMLHTKDTVDMNLLRTAFMLTVVQPLLIRERHMIYWCWFGAVRATRTVLRHELSAMALLYVVTLHMSQHLLESSLHVLHELRGAHLGVHMCYIVRIEHVNHIEYGSPIFVCKSCLVALHHNCSLVGVVSVVVCILWRQITCRATYDLKILINQL